MKKSTSAGAGRLYEALKIKFGMVKPGDSADTADGVHGIEAEAFAPDMDKGKGATDAPLALDDTERVKVLSPGRLVVKRFFRNKLAMVGLSVLLLMFSFSFLGPLLYPYTQTQLFYKYDYLNINYASATERTENISYAIPGGPEMPSAVANRLNSNIIELEKEGVTEKTFITADGDEYVVTKLGNRVYTLSSANTIPVGTYQRSEQVVIYDGIRGSFEWAGSSPSKELESAVLSAIEAGEAVFEHQEEEYIIASTRNRHTVSRMVSGFSGALPGDGFISAVEENLDGGDFIFGAKTYHVTDTGGGSFDVSEIGDAIPALVASTYVFDSHDVSVVFSDEFKVNALLAIYDGGSFTYGGDSFVVNQVGDDLFISDDYGKEIADLSIYSIRRYSGQDTLSIDFKETVQDVIERMTDDNVNTAEFIYAIHEIDESGVFLYNDDGSPRYANAEITVTRKHTGEYVLTCEQVTYLIDIFAPPGREHWFGTDGDGMDILSRMMYGGRVTLMVGFLVVILETGLGVIMGGLSGFFGGWVDTLIMRIADAFYCVPGYPILIIMGALFDKLKMDPYRRLAWMMVILGILGWAVVARLVRGQILSLREQEFMIAQEATGMRARQRIFRHLIPNVMPQLIVTATMGVGEVIIYESTLSFLGLGVKHPLATWGTMIDAVTRTAESMIKYSYIWVPIGLLICLTVISFNFTGDGLRDAFDPKMRR